MKRRKIMNKNMEPKVLGVELYSKGWGVSNFLSEYGISNIEDLRTCLFKAIPDKGKVGKMIRDMKKNEKKKKSGKKQNQQLGNETMEKNTEYVSAKKDTMATAIPYNPQANYPAVIKAVEGQLATAVIEKAEEPAQDTQINSNPVGEQLLQSIKVVPINATVLETVGKTVATSNETAEKDNSVIEDNSDEKLIILNNRLETINDKIAKSEIAIKDYHSRKRAVSKKLDDIVVNLKKLENQLLDQKQKFDDAYAESVAIDEGVNAEKQVLNGLNATKDEIISEINELMAITLYCGSNDQELERAFDYKLVDFDIDSTDVTAKFKEFFERDDEKFDEFSVSDLKKVAKIILAEEEIKGETDSKVELYFDSENNLTSIFKLMERKVIILGE